MQQPAYVPLYADRFTAFSRTLTVGFNMLDRTLRGQVRETKNKTGAPAVALRWNTNPNATGLRPLVLTASAGKIGIFITKADIAAIIPSLSNDGQMAALTPNDLNLVYDILVTYADGTEETLISGPFVLRAGVSQ